MEDFDSKTCDERMAYFFIDQCGAFIWRMNHDMADGRIEAKHHAGIDGDIMRVRERQQEAVAALTRFGLKPVDDAGRPTAEYWAWYRWWDSWKKGMSNEEWRECDSAMTRGMTPEEDARFRPSGDWRDSLTEAQP